MIIGITGTSGSGKSYVCSIMAQYGYTVIDMDKIAHDIYEKDSMCINEIRNHFGESVFDKNGILDRKALGKIVFSNKEELVILNKITHKYIMKEAKRQMINKNIILDAPLLIGTAFENLCDIKIAVVSDINVKIERITARDNISYQYAMNRISSQMKDEEIAQKCDYVIENNGDEEKLKKSIEEIFSSIHKGI